MAVVACTESRRPIQPGDLSDHFESLFDVCRSMTAPQFLVVALNIVTGNQCIFRGKYVCACRGLSLTFDFPMSGSHHRVADGTVLHLAPCIVLHPDVRPAAVPGGVHVQLSRLYLCLLPLSLMLARAYARVWPSPSTWLTAHTCLLICSMAVCFSCSSHPLTCHRHGRAGRLHIPDA